MTTMQIDRAVVEQALEALEYDNPAGRSATIRALRAALAQQKDPTDPGNDVDVLREHVRHLERRIRELHAQQAEPLNLSDPAVQKRLASQWGYVPAAAQAEPLEPVAGVVLNEEGRAALVEYGREEWHCVVRNARRLYTAPPKDEPKPMHPELRKLWEDYFDKCFRAMPVPKQAEPVAWLQPKTVDGHLRPDLGYETCSKTDYGAFSVYTAPPQRKPLTEEEIERIGMKHVTLREVIRAVERAHGIGETQ